MAEPITNVTKIVAGVCISITVALILWLCNSVVGHETRVTVLESNVGYIRGDISEIKALSKEMRDELRKANECPTR